MHALRAPFGLPNGWWAETEWRTVQTGVSCFREECASAQGKKLWAAPLQLGARGAAVPCQSKPLTRTWMSAAGQ